MTADLATKVPVLTSEAFEKPLPDSLNITFYIAERYPSLIPAELQDTIKEQLLELHDLNYFSLSFGARPHQAEKLLIAVDERLKGDLSDKYRGALEHKRQHTLEHKWKGVQPHEVAHNVAKARALMRKLDGLLLSNKNWLFGSVHPTALDAHLVIFIARMIEVGRTELLTERLLEYHENASKTEEYKRVMGRSTTMIGVGRL